jgi:WD40 repeat protein
VNEVIAIAPDGKRAWIATDAGELRAADTSTGVTVEKFKPSSGWDEGRPELAISHDGSIVYMGQGRHAIHRLDVKAANWLPPIKGASRGKLIPHPDGKRLLVIGNDGVLRRYDLTTLKQLPGTEGFEFNVRAYASPNGQRIAIASSTNITPTAEGRLDLFDTAGKSLCTARPGDHWTMSGWSPDSRSLALVGNFQITLVDAATGKPAQVLRPADKNHQFQISAHFFPDGNKLIAPLNFGDRLAVFDLKSGTQQTVTSHGAIGATDLSHDGRTLAHFAEDGGLRLFDVVQGRFTSRWSGPPTRDRQSVDPHPRFSPDGSYLLTWELECRAPTFSPQTMAILRDPANLAVKGEFEAREASTIAFSPDGQWLALGTPHGDWSLWDIPTGDRLGVWEGHRDRITSIGFAGPGRVLTGSEDLTAILWDLKPKEKAKKPNWEALSGKDGRDAHRAVWALAADPKAIELLREKVPVQTVPVAEKVKQWVADLAADRFAVREAATKSLQDLGRLAEPDLRAARDKAYVEEVRSRLDNLLAKIPRERVGIEIVHARAVLAMELAGTEAAKKLLAEWAAGAPGARLTIDAKAALARLAAGR